jgi:hypothetical protein
LLVPEQVQPEVDLSLAMARGFCFVWFRN